MKNITKISTVLCIFFVQTAQGYFPINVFRPWDINLRPPLWCGSNWQVTTYYEGGYKTRAVNGVRHEGNVLTLWQETQDAISMLKGFDSDSPMTELLHKMESEVGGVLIENGTRGHFRVKGDFDFQAGFGIFPRYHFPYNFTFGVGIPFYAMRMKNIAFENLTSATSTDIQDIVVRENLTDDFFKNVAAFDPTLDLRNGWDRIGLGDVTLLAEWRRDFPQAKPILRNVRLDVRGGLTLPTGLKKDENKVLSIPFGNDGSTGLIFGSGIVVNWLDCLFGGIDFELLQLFGTHRSQRVKTNSGQTDFLLLAKDRVFKDFGFIQRFNLQLGFNNLGGGLWGALVYQFFKHSRDTLSLRSLQYSDLAANTAESLKEWTIHQAIFEVGYDFQDMLDEYTAFRPQVMAFCKFPFNGKRAVLVHTAGFTFTLNF